jgi:hypothetical protein
MMMGLQEIIFTQMLLKEIVYCIDAAIILENNTGVIFVIKNSTSWSKNKTHCGAIALSLQALSEERL